MVPVSDIQMAIKHGTEVNIFDGNRYYTDPHWYVVRDGSNKAERISVDQLPNTVKEIMKPKPDVEEAGK